MRASIKAEMNLIAGKTCKIGGKRRQQSSLSPVSIEISRLLLEFFVEINDESRLRVLPRVVSDNGQI